MTCRQLRPFIVDFARGAIDAAAVEAQLASHVQACAACRTVFERERMMSAALQRVAEASAVPPADPARELALQSAFARANAGWPTGVTRAWIRLAPVAAVIAMVVIVWGLKVRTPSGLFQDGPVTPDVAAVQSAERQRVKAEASADEPDVVLDASSFVAWPGAASGPPLESGTLIRVDLPVSILPALGFWPPSSAGGDVPVDILIGQDGFARAFRLASE